VASTSPIPIAQRSTTTAQRLATRSRRDALGQARDLTEAARNRDALGATADRKLAAANRRDADLDEVSRWRQAATGACSCATASGQPPVLVLMGVSGCGKSTVAGLLAGRLGRDFEEGDELDPAAEWIGEYTDAGQPGIVTCSALKKGYATQDIAMTSEESSITVAVAASASLESNEIITRLGLIHKASIQTTE
jgi:hypothetical protein